MKKAEFSFSYDVYETIEELNEQDAILLNKAREVTKNAYAPYSKFYVGAIAKLNNGEFLEGTNQENASYPVGICAERALLSSAASLFPNVPIDTLAISYLNEKGDSNNPISPCGMCRQALLEYEGRVNQSIRIILSGQSGKVYIVEQAGMLLPLSFTSKDLLT